MANLPSSKAEMPSSQASVAVYIGFHLLICEIKHILTRKILTLKAQILQGLRKENFPLPLFLSSLLGKGDKFI